MAEKMWKLPEKCRLCTVDDINTAAFHMWAENNDIPSAVIEFRDGQVKIVPAENVIFLDSPERYRSFRERKRDKVADLPERNCETCVYQGQDDNPYTCKNCVMGSGYVKKED